ncbi:3-hydroxyacyl-CoA dehydrogenase NAD-binding domain-containing protein [Terasakiella sp. A23]|uniref:3-hydroxyacyl-CoA dehydrogenase/enoyl-CoA hydratase family protein n=1 Tax=Terasakiella sp. FCG-A23 TaxID=3080561 RepID=UPI002954D9C6|nr:3-hydroxyacyl-CoA dehydrogenase NAD-binding domain-containing protein [Terasakiella sp. A23]MDV7341544.1 3-hydroxyacyl-CoA dehydrogenase NAD-binding domain-containing protein [Terasakiella sp. A23]
MNTSINKVCVIGAGVMGANIAAHVANAGHEVLLLDIVEDAAAKAIQKMLKANPAPLMHKRNAKLITPGNLEEHLPLISDCDWVVEAIVERLDLKQDLYKKIDEIRKGGSIVSSNTSTLPLSLLTKGMSEDFTKDFMITHFFNPPRYMRLLEIVKSGATDQTAVNAMEAFADLKLGKSIVFCKDRPGFIANRLGVFWLMCAALEAFDQGLSVEEADSVIGKPMGIPKTGVFALLDMVGLDLMPHVIGSMVQALPETDAFCQIHKPMPLVEKMIGDGYTGRKGKGGFYRLDKKRNKEGIDLASGDYRRSIKSTLASAKLKGIKKLVSHPDKGGKYAWSVMAQTLCYACNLVGEAADTIADIDEAMRLGYNWKFGPFELIDMMGADWFAAKLEEDGYDVPVIIKTANGQPFYKIEKGKRQQMTLESDYIPVTRPDGVVLLEDIKRTDKPLLKNGSASLWDIGDGVVCFEFTSMMNSLDGAIMELMQKSLALVAKEYKAMVIYNEGTNFSVGANLGIALFTANIAAWSELEGMVKGGQDTMKTIKYAPFPVVGAPSGMALGGGCEFLLHCDAVQAHAETYTGLVEVGVGIIPAWGGCKEMLARWTTHPKYAKGPMPAASKIFENVGTAKVATSAFEAKDMMIVNHNDTVTMNRYRLLADAKAKALSLVDGYKAPEETTFHLSGESGRVAFKMAVQNFVKTGHATPHDLVVSEHLAHVLTGGEDGDMTQEQSEDDILTLERKHFMTLVRTPDTLARVEHMLLTNKPLRN